MKPRKLDTFTVGFRTGGTENFKWRRTLPYATREEAEKAVKEIEASGYPCLIYHTSELDAIGLPDTFE